MPRLVRDRLLGGPPIVAAALAAGIAAAPGLDRAGSPEAARWVAAVAVIVLAARWPALIAAAAFALGLARGAAPVAPVAPGVDDRGVDRVVGEVVGPVVRTARGTGALLDRSGGRGGDADGDGDGVWVWADATLAPGERIAVTGLLVTPRGPRGPGLPDRALALRGRGARYELTARTIEHLADAPDLAARLWRWAAAIQADGARAIDDAGGDPIGRAALRGIALGDRADVPAELDARWRACGIYHVLSVSGLHLGIIALLCFRLLRRAIAASPWGGRVHPARWAGAPTLAVAAAYTLITGGQLATVRAAVVVAIAVIGAMLDRPLRMVDALAAAAIVLLAWRPLDLFDPAFQLSFTAAITLAVRPPDRGRTWARRWIVRPIASSLWIAIATAPITAFHFHEVAVGGVIGNVVLTPALELVALPLALAGLVVGWDGPVWLASWLVAGVDRLAAPLADVVPVGRIAVASPVVMAALVVIVVALARRRARGLLDAAGWAALCAGWLLARAPAGDGELRITFVDVDQGDAAVVELPDGGVWLIDAGGLASARDPARAASPGKTIARVLAAYGHARIDVAVISHPHPDHYLGLRALDVPIGELWLAPDAGPRGELAAIADALAARGTRIVHPPLGVAITRGDVVLETWAPRYQAAAGGVEVLAADPVRTVNDNSLVVAVRYRGRRVLFAGDLEDEGEQAVVGAGLPPVDVVKVAHHGSPTSSTAAFVAATRPAIAVISCGRANAFGFPAAAVVARWRAAGAAIARTDVDGTVTVTIDDHGALALARALP